jgi:hypothetical protein
MSQCRIGGVQVIILGCLLMIPCGLLRAQQPTATTPASTDPATTPAAPPPAARTQPGTTANPQDEKIDKRVLGVLPNYRTAPMSAKSEPITARQKLTIAAKDSFDWPIYFLSAGFAGLYQLENQNPSFGQGVKGYAHRLGTSFVDQTFGNMMTEGIMPSLLHEDPRYFRKGEGGVWGRIWYAGTRVMVTRTDAGTARFNYSEWVGNGAAAALGNWYYPGSRGLDATFERTYTEVATDAISQELKEFWPDIKRRWFKHHDKTADATSLSQH